MPSPAIAAPPSNAAPMAAVANASSSGSAADAQATIESSGPIGADFAALLLAQMGTAVDLVAGADVAAKAEPKEATDDSAKSTDGTDMSALFAALAFVQQAPTVVPQAAPTAKVAADSAIGVEGLDIGRKATATPELAGATAETAAPVAPPAGNDASDLGAGDKQNGKAATFAAFDATLKQAEAKADISAPVLPDAPPAVHAAHQAHGAPNQVSAPTQARVDTPVRDPGFGQEFSQKIVWLAGQDKQSAQLTLNPPQLGPVEVSLKISGDQATAVFSSPHAEVREAIEAALPRLREMMGSAGLELGQANVSSQSFQQQQQQQQAAQGQATASRGGSGGGILGESDSAAAPITGTVIRQGNGLVDTFA